MYRTRAKRSLWCDDLITYLMKEREREEKSYIAKPLKEYNGSRVMINECERKEQSVDEIGLVKDSRIYLHYFLA